MTIAVAPGSRATEADHSDCPECAAVFQRDTDRINHLHKALERIRDRNVKRELGKDKTVCFLCGSDDGQHDIRQPNGDLFSCGIAAEALANIPHNMLVLGQVKL